MVVDKQFYGVAEVSAITGISKCTLYRAIAQKKIPTLKILSTLRIPKWWVDQVGQPGDGGGTID